jgi:hypothetical protein
MKRLLLLSIILLTACGPSPEEKKNIAAVTCSIMGETRNMDSAVRIEKMNNAREKIGGEPFLDGDYVIKESFEYGLCQELVLNENYNERLQSRKDAQRERARLAEEERAEERMIAAKKRRLAAMKPSVEERFFDSGKIRCRINRAPAVYNGGWEGKKHGLEECWHENGNLKEIANWNEGKMDGLWQQYNSKGHLAFQYCWKNGTNLNFDQSGDILNHPYCEK